MRRNWGEPEREAAGQYARCQCRQRPLSLARPDELVKGAGAAWGDPGLALAVVLRVSAENIRMRNGAGSEVLATANIGSTRHPQYAQYGVGDGRIRPLRTF